MRGKGLLPLTAALCPTLLSACAAASSGGGDGNKRSCEWLPLCCPPPHKRTPTSTHLPGSPPSVSRLGTAMPELWIKHGDSGEGRTEPPQEPPNTQGVWLGGEGGPIG